MADRTPSSERSTDPPEVRPTNNVEQDGVPDILEVFGAAPLVDAELDDRDTDERVAEPDSTEFASEVTPSEAAPQGEPPADNSFEAQNDAPEAAVEQPAPELDQPVAPEPIEVDTPPNAVPDPAAFEALTDAVSGSLMLLEQRMGSLEETLDGVSKQNSFVPPKLRGLGKKVDELSSSIADGRLRELCSELVSLVDLLDAGLEETQDESAQRTLSAVGTRLKQSLDSRGLNHVDTAGDFDPTLHQALERRVVDDPEQDGKVVEVFRQGWRDAHSVLRYADVAVGAYEAAQVAATNDDVADGDENADLSPATLTPGNVRAAAAPRRHDESTDSPDDEGDTDRTAAKASSRNTKKNTKDNA